MVRDYLKAPGIGMVGNFLSQPHLCLLFLTEAKKGEAKDRAR